MRDQRIKVMVTQKEEKQIIREKQKDAYTYLCLQRMTRAWGKCVIKYQFQYNNGRLKRFTEGNKGRNGFKGKKRCTIPKAIQHHLFP